MLQKKKPEAQSDQEFTLEVNAPAEAESKRGFFKKHKKLLIAIVCVLVAAAVFLFVLPKRSARPASTQSAYIEVKPETRDITNTYSDSGTITAADSYNVTSLVTGTVLTADFEVGDTVQAGDVLYTIDSSDANTQLEQAQLSLTQAQNSYDEAVDAQYIRSSIAGTLVSLDVRAGDLVQQGQQIATVRDDSTMLLTLEFPAADAANFYAGQSATVTLNGTFEQISGTVLSVSGADAVSSGNMLTRTVTISVQNSGSLTAAMAAVAEINGVSSLASANLQYQREQTITASSSGTVAALCVSAGSKVSAGTALVQISDDSITKQIDNAYNNLRSAQLSMENTQEQLDNYTITAPISGTIVQKNVKAGEKISTGGTSTLCTIYDMSYLEMTVNVDELEIRSIEAGQKATITVDAVSDRTYEGVVTSVLNVGTTSGGTTTYPVTIRIDDTENLMSGMNATAEITVASAGGALSIPNAAVVNGNYVLITKDSPSASNADTSMTAPDGYVYVKVETGVSDNDYIAVTSGLTAEDTVAYDASSTASSTTDAAFDMGNMPSGGDFGGGGMPSGGGAPGGGFNG